MDTFSDRLRRKMKEYKETQESLAEKINCSHGLIGQYLRGSRRPRLGNLEKLANVLETTPEWLMYGVPDYQVEDSGATYQLGITVPLLSWSSVFQIIHQQRFSSKIERIPYVGKSDVNNCYALLVKGDSMYSSAESISFPPNATIFVDKDMPHTHKDFVIAYQPNAEEAIFRQYMTEGNEIYLKPLNSQYPIINITPETHILGVVVSFMMNLKD